MLHLLSNVKPYAYGYGVSPSASLSFPGPRTISLQPQVRVLPKAVPAAGVICSVILRLRLLASFAVIVYCVSVRVRVTSVIAVRIGQLRQAIRVEVRVGGSGRGSPLRFRSLRLWLWLWLRQWCDLLEFSHLRIVYLSCTLFAIVLLSS